MSMTAGQIIVAMLESDLAVVGGTPLLNLLTTLQKDAGNTPAQVAAVLSFGAQAPLVGIQLLVEEEQQLLGWAITKLTAFQAAQAAKVVQPVPVGTTSVSG